ncbi:acyl-CoA dehydrogenase [Zavarzinia sp. CC-PAN008]|uniref:acyl-CoA dehydrogenase n=1 Tax=Zavarzinia sp. CC-PAN008 TaxID=3243332 RepID=UPI003F74585B
MQPYRAPLSDLHFALSTAGGLDRLGALEPFEQASPELVNQILEEAGKLAADVLAPLNEVGDREGCSVENGVVRTPTGFREAYRAYADGGWPGLAFDPEHGGQGLPFTLAVAIQELWSSANLAFGLVMLLNQGAVEAISTHGTEEQKATYLAPMIEGRWTGTMNLTEPQSGSDLGTIKTRAVPAGDGTWRIQGSKIFITFGEHDLVENIVHLVLARTPDAPEGTRGISCFIVPKFLVNADGSLGQRNDLRCVSIEHKLGIHGSPTCTMAYGDNGNCVGYLIGQQHRGLAAMFTMMNNARLSVGVQGLAVSERAYQQALAFAQERRQGRALGSKETSSPIIEHADVRRMLMTMKSTILAMRALVLRNALAIDLSRALPDQGAREAERAMADLLTPVSKGWCTDRGVELTSLGVQIHGGMGFVEETGAAQHLRDSRICPIYEGTNGIQAIDLVTRKLTGAPRAAFDSLVADMRATAARLASHAALGAAAATLQPGIDALVQAADWLTAQGGEDALAGATPFLELFGSVAGGHFLLAQAEAALAQGEAQALGRVQLTRFFVAQRVPPAAALLATIMGGGAALSRAEVEPLWA